jgi:hypothetical protein
MALLVRDPAGDTASSLSLPVAMKGALTSVPCTAVDILTSRGDWPGLPDNLLPLCHWGCAIYSFVQCPSGRMFGWDPNPVAAGDDVPFFDQEYTLTAWLAAWLDGSLRQPWLVTDPASGHYRGATIAETEAALADIDGDDARL